MVTGSHCPLPTSIFICISIQTSSNGCSCLHTASIFGGGEDAGGGGSVGAPHPDMVRWSQLPSLRITPRRAGVGEGTSGGGRAGVAELLMLAWSF